ncbi:MAG: hypothetical protein ABSB91_00370 [Sedimentisphaerales bacterium]|jgi:hypothetical protein
MPIEYDNPLEVKTATKITSDIRCPICFGGLPYPQVISHEIDKHGNKIRTYFGWCFECNCGYAVIQFAKGQHWIIHKYKEYTLSGHLIDVCGMKIDKCQPQDEWTILTDLPRPAPIITGPGGDFIKEITPELSQFRTNIKVMQGALGNLLKKIDEMFDGND